MRVFLGGVFHRAIFQLSDSQIEQLVREELKDLLGIHAKPILISVRRYPSSMPQYLVGHLDRVASLEKNLLRYPGLYLAGNACRGVGIPDCIRAAEEAAGQIVQFFQKGGSPHESNAANSLGVRHCSL